MKFIQSRKLSPWVLLNSKAFLSFLKNNVNREEQKLIKAVINIDQWREKFQKDEETAGKIRKFVADLSL